MRVVRLTLHTDRSSDRFFIDREHNGSIDNRENCSAILQYVQQQLKDGAILPAMLCTGGISTVDKEGKIQTDPYYGAQPAMLNLANVSFIVIDEVTLCTQEPVEDVTEQAAIPTTEEVHAE